MVASVSLVACGEQSNVDPDAAVTVSGEMHAADGSALASRPVRLGSGVTPLEGGAGFLSAGLFCLSGECSGDFFDTTTAADGTYAIELSGQETRSSFGEATSFSLSTSAAPTGDRAEGPAISARFRIQTTDVVLPVMQLVDPGLVLHPSGPAVVARWDGSAAPAPFTLGFETGSGGVVWQHETTEGTATIDGRVLEDSSGQATVSGSLADDIEGSDVAISWRSSTAAYRGGHGPPASRGATCEVRDVNRTARPLERCRLTDGSYGAAGIGATVCPDADAQVDAGTQTCAPFDAVRVHLPSPLPADPSALAEVSVWSGVPAAPALLPAAGPAAGDLPGTAAGSDGDDQRLPASIAGILVAAASVLLVVVVRRRRASSEGTSGPA